jgi:Mrp family chromosome partitioning ATPase
MIEPINFFKALRQGWRLVVILIMICVVSALVIPASVTKHSKSKLKWETLAVVGAPASSGLFQGTVSQAQILFYANTYPVKLAAVAEVGLKGDPYEYAGGMFGSTLAAPTNGLYPTGPEGPSSAATAGKRAAAAGGNVTLYASGPTRELAAALSNAFAKQLGIILEQKAAALAAQTATSGAPTSTKSAASTTSTTSTTSPTAANGSPFAATSTGYQVIFPGTPQVARRINLPHTNTLDSHKARLLIGVIVGGILGLLIILVREVLIRTIRRSGRAAHHLKFPVIADIPKTYPPDPGVVDVVDRPTSPAAEAYRKLRMSVLFESMASDAAPTGAGGDAFADMFGMSAAQGEPYMIPEPGSRNVLLVSSTMDEPSRAKVVANLAATYAEAGETVIVVSTGDLEVGTSFRDESIHSGPVLATDIERWMTPAGPDNVAVLSMRHFMRNSGQLVSRSKAVLDAAREAAAVVVVETPAFLRYHHGEAMVHSVDAVLVVVENGVTEASDARDMGDILRRLGAPVLGVVFTGGELSKGRKRDLDVSLAASGRSGTFDTADADGVPELGDDAGAGDDASLPTRQLNPS